MKKALLFGISIAIVLFSACGAPDEEPTPTPSVIVDNSTKDTIVEITTEFGAMYLYLYKGTPLHRANFHKLASEGFYDTTEFHRIIQNFMIQGGDPLSKDDDRTNDGTGGPGYTIPAEIDTTRYKHDLGSIAAARTNNPEKASSGCQFYIVVSEEGTKHLNGLYTVFGKMLEGNDVADSIVTRKTGASNRPVERIPMYIKLIPKTHNQLKKEFDFIAE